MPGTIIKRGDSWRLQVTIGTDFRGKPIRYSKTVKGTRKQAERELAKFYADCEAGNVNESGNFTVEEMCNDVMRQSVVPNAKRNTSRGYNICLNRIKGTIGNLKASKVTPRHVQEWVNELSANGLSPKTIKNTYSFLHMCFETMVSWRMLGESPCHHIKLPKNERKTPPYLTKDEFIAFVNALETIPRDNLDYKIAFMLALFCGLRRGEICGLNDEDVDTEACELTVKRTRNIGKEGIYEDSPKSKSSTRLCAMPNELAFEINRLRTFHKERQLLLGSKWEHCPALLKNACGGPIHPGSILEQLKRFCKENQLKKTHVHALRHTHASMMKWMGYDLLDVSAELGHSEKSTTLNVYAHIFEDRKEKAHNMAAGISSLIANSK